MRMKHHSKAWLIDTNDIDIDRTNQSAISSTFLSTTFVLLITSPCFQPDISNLIFPTWRILCILPQGKGKGPGGGALMHGVHGKPSGSRGFDGDDDGEDDDEEGQVII